MIVTDSKYGNICAKNYLFRRSRIVPALRLIKPDAQPCRKSAYRSHKYMLLFTLLFPPVTFISFIIFSSAFPKK